MLFGRKSRPTVDIHAPFDGEVIPVNDVPDPVFAGKMVGDGVALIPLLDADSVTVCAPVAGELTTLFKTGHAFAVVSEEGLEVLVHIGLDTVELKGEGFRVLAAQGDRVTVGQPIIEVDVDLLRRRELNPVTPVVMSKRAQVDHVDVVAGSASVGAHVATVTMA